jgi:hypothetical protein
MSHKNAAAVAKFFALLSAYLVNQKKPILYRELSLDTDRPSKAHASSP